MSAQQQKVVTDNSALTEAKSPQFEISDRGEFPDLVELKPRAKAQPVRSRVHTHSPMPGVTGWILPERKQVASSTSESTFAKNKRKPVFGVARVAAELGVSLNMKRHQQSRADADPQGTASDNESGELSMGDSDDELPDLPLTRPPSDPVVFAALQVPSALLEHCSPFCRQCHSEFAGRSVFIISTLSPCCASIPQQTG